MDCRGALPHRLSPPICSSSIPFTVASFLIFAFLKQFSSFSSFTFPPPFLVLQFLFVFLTLCHSSSFSVFFLFLLLLSSSPWFFFFHLGVSVVDNLSLFSPSTSFFPLTPFPVIFPLELSIKNTFTSPFLFLLLLVFLLLLLLPIAHWAHLAPNQPHWLHESKISLNFTWMWFIVCSWPVIICFNHTSRNVYKLYIMLCMLEYWLRFRSSRDWCIICKLDYPTEPQDNNISLKWRKGIFQKEMESWHRVEESEREWNKMWYKLTEGGRVRATMIKQIKEWEGEKEKCEGS